MTADAMAVMTRCSWDVDVMASCGDAGGVGDEYDVTARETAVVVLTGEAVVNSVSESHDLASHDLARMS